VSTIISHEFYHRLLKYWCAQQHFPCLLHLSAEILVCLPIFPMNFIIVSWNLGVPTNIFLVFYPYLLKSRSRCANQHFHWILSFSVENQVYLPLFSMSLIIVCWNPGVPTDISHEFYHCLLKTRCAYQHFPWILSLFAEIQVCLPTFLMNFIIFCWEPVVPANISPAIYHCLLKSWCAYQHFPCLYNLSVEILVCLPTFYMSFINACWNRCMCKPIHQHLCARESSLDE